MSQNDGTTASIEVPTATVIIDCIKTQDPLGPERRSGINDLLASLAESKVQATSIRILVSSEDYPRPDPALFGFEKGTTSIYTLSGTTQNFLSTPAFSGVTTEFMLLLRCPTTQATEGSSEGRTDFIASLVQIAGTEQYGNKALATSGFSRRPLHTSDSTFGVIAYGPERRSSLDGQHDEVIYRQLSESRPVDMPYGNLFVKSEWLAALAISSEDQSSQEQQQGRGGIIAELGRRLDHQLKVKTWALPLPFHGTHAPLVHQAEFLNYARQLLGDSAVAAEDPTGMDRTLGSPAKIAVLLSNPDLEYATSWMNIICGFADEAIYGHEVQVFSSLDVEDGRDFVLECLEVEVHTLTADSLRAWTPDICLASVEAAGTRIALDPSYFTISTPGAELAHLDWLHALPLESLLSR